LPNAIPVGIDSSITPLMITNCIKWKILAADARLLIESSGKDASGDRCARLGASRTTKLRETGILNVGNAMRKVRRLG